MAPETSPLDVIEILAMLMTGGMTYAWVYGRIVGWPPPPPLPPGAKGVFPLAVSPIRSVGSAAINHFRLAA